MVLLHTKQEGTRAVTKKPQKLNWSYHRMSTELVFASRLFLAIMQADSLEEAQKYATTGDRNLAPIARELKQEKPPRLRQRTPTDKQ